MGLAAALEAILFASSEPLSARRLSGILGVGEEEIRGLLADLDQNLKARGSGLVVRHVAGGFVLTTRPELHDYVRRVSNGRRPWVLSRAATETLAIILYKQPVTKAEIDHIRGVNSEAALESLMERGLVEEAGRAKAPGRPVLYRTSRRCLLYLGINSLDELPPLPGLSERQG